MASILIKDTTRPLRRVQSGPAQDVRRLHQWHKGAAGGQHGVQCPLCVRTDRTGSERHELRGRTLRSACQNSRNASSFLPFRMQRDKIAEVFLIGL